jgi:hypothetical protein
VAHTCILATQEAEIRRITVQSQPGHTVLRDPVSKIPIIKIGLVEWLKVNTLSSNPSTAKKKKSEKTTHRIGENICRSYI